MLPAGKALRRWSQVAQRIVQEDLIDNQRQPVPHADRFQSLALAHAGPVARWIVRMYHQDRSCARRNRPLQFALVDPPAVIVKERIGPQPHIVQIGQKVEERVARLRHQDLVAWVAQQAK